MYPIVIEDPKKEHPLLIVSLDQPFEVDSKAMLVIIFGSRAQFLIEISILKEYIIHCDHKEAPVCATHLISRSCHIFCVGHGAFHIIYFC